MSRSKYINTFDTTAEYNNYIESALPAFPNVGYDKEADKVNIVRTSPNDHVLYGEVVDAAQPVPTIQLYNNYSNVKTYTPTLDTVNNTFYIDDWGTLPTFNTLSGDFLKNKSNIKSIKKLKGLDTSKVTTMSYMFIGCRSLTSLDLSNFDTSKVTDMQEMFNGCSSLTTLDLSNFDTSKVTTMSYMFQGCSSLKDVYITVESTLNKLTNNLTSQGNNYVPSSATIHYNGVDYKWQNSRWTPQS